MSWPYEHESIHHYFRWYIRSLFLVVKGSVKTFQFAILKIQARSAPALSALSLRRYIKLSLWFICRISCNHRNGRNVRAKYNTVFEKDLIVWGAQVKLVLVQRVLSKSMKLTMPADVITAENKFMMKHVSMELYEPVAIQWQGATYWVIHCWIIIVIWFDICILKTMPSALAAVVKYIMGMYSDDVTLR